jgi:hypothetical protein
MSKKETELAEDSESSAHVRTFSLLATLLIAIGAFLAGLFLRNPPLSAPPTQPAPQRQNEAVAVEGWPTAPPTFTVAPTSVRQPQATPTPLRPPTWSELGHLTAIKFSASTIVSEERPQLLGSDKIMLLVAGDILMGVDLKQVKPSDVEIEGHSITLTLPRASITGVELRLDQSQIYDSQRSWSSWLTAQDSGLEKDALAKAQQQLYDYSKANESMIELTEMLARLQLSEFLQKAGFSKVEIRFPEMPAD